MVPNRLEETSKQIAFISLLPCQKAVVYRLEKESLCDSSSTFFDLYKYSNEVAYT